MLVGPMGRAGVGDKGLHRTWRSLGAVPSRRGVLRGFLDDSGTCGVAGCLFGNCCRGGRVCYLLCRSVAIVAPAFPGVGP